MTAVPRAPSAQPRDVSPDVKRTKRSRGKAAVLEASMECELEHERERRRDARAAGNLAARSAIAATEGETMCLTDGAS